jgi:hypothetical protein
MVLRWLVQKVSKREEFLINFQSRYWLCISWGAYYWYGRMGIKVWIMKGEGLWKEIFLHLLEWTRNKLGKVEIREIQL